MWSDRADEAYKRLTRTINVPAGGGSLSFWTSYNLELDFDYMIVEAHTVGQDDWTTLPDLNGHTSSDLSSDQSCPGGWSNPDDAANVLHPFLTHYQTFDPATGTCSSTGTSGEWNAANGSSSGWQQLEFDLAPYAGQQVEISITSVSDWGFQQFPGVFIDDIETSTGEGNTSFEDDGGPDGTAGPSPARPRTRPGSRARTATTGCGEPASGSRRARPSPPRTRSTWASGSRGSATPRPATRSWVARSTTCCPDDTAAG